MKKRPGRTELELALEQGLHKIARESGVLIPAAKAANSSNDVWMDDGIIAGLERIHRIADHHACLILAADDEFAEKARPEGNEEAA